MKSPIFLIGFMASGKTTLGSAVAQAMGCEFIDLDQYIEQQEQLTIAQIFKQKGEAEFRRLETHALVNAASLHPSAIIACGGGTPCFGSNMQTINSLGTSVWLNPSADRIVRRLEIERSARPLVASLTPHELHTYVATTLAERTPFYSQAHLQFPQAEHLETEQQVASAVEHFTTLISQHHPL